MLWWSGVSLRVSVNTWCQISHQNHCQMVILPTGDYHFAPLVITLSQPELRTGNTMVTREYRVILDRVACTGRVAALRLTTFENKALTSEKEKRGMDILANHLKTHKCVWIQQSVPRAAVGIDSRGAVYRSVLHSVSVS